MRAQEIFTRSADIAELGEYWDAVEAGDEWEPFCVLCDTVIKTRNESVEIFFKNDFQPEETIDNSPDLGVAAHQACVQRQEAIGNVVTVSQW